MHAAPRMERHIYINFLPPDPVPCIYQVAVVSSTHIVVVARVEHVALIRPQTALSCQRQNHKLARPKRSATKMAENCVEKRLTCVAVYCGANVGKKPIYEQVATGKQAGWTGPSVVY